MDSRSAPVPTWNGSQWHVGQTSGDSILVKELDYFVTCRISLTRVRVERKTGVA